MNNKEDVVRAKMTAGLTREQAEEVYEAQKAHDATNPHDTVPKQLKSEPELPEDLNTLTVAQLKEVAAGKGVEIHSDMNKSEIIDAIEAAIE